MYFNENRSAEMCFLNTGNPLNWDFLNRGLTVFASGAINGMEVVLKCDRCIRTEGRTDVNVE